MSRPGDRPTTRRHSLQKARKLARLILRNSLLASGLFTLSQVDSGFSFIPAAQAADASKSNLIHHPSLGFKIPFDIDAADKAYLKSIELYVSDNQGANWRLSSSTNPSSKAFTFRAAKDGEYWFAVRTLDVDGRYNPSDDKPIMPDWRVVVDTKKPGLGLESIARRGPIATIRWDARDENLDLGSLVLEFALPETGEWKRIPLNKPTPNGETSWDTGTSEPIKVRATVADKAGNVQHAETELSDGAAQRPSSGNRLANTMDNDAPAPIAHMASASTSRGILGPHANSESRPKATSPDWVDTPSSSGYSGAGTSTRGRYRSQENTPDPRRSQSIASTGVQADARQVPLISNPKFPLNYSVDDAGPNGPAVVELWVTRDGGKNWSRWAEDSDRTSPMEVDLGGEGVYGLSIVARSLAGQGDEIPRSGTAPQMWVEVDSTPPSMILNVIKVGVGSQSGKVLISWQADDRNFGPRPISIFYRPETSTKWIPIAEGIENSGQFVWTPGPQVPPVFHVRVEGADEAGSRAGVDTTEYEPVLLDRTRPKARILGLNSGPAQPRRTGSEVSPQPSASIIPPSAESKPQAQLQESPSGTATGIATPSTSPVAANPPVSNTPAPANKDPEPPVAAKLPESKPEPPAPPAAPPSQPPAQPVPVSAKEPEKKEPLAPPGESKPAEPAPASSQPKNEEPPRLPGNGLTAPGDPAKSFESVKPPDALRDATPKSDTLSVEPPAFEVPLADPAPEPSRKPPV